MKQLLKSHPGTRALVIVNATLVVLVVGLSLLPAKASVSGQENGGKGAAGLPQFGDTSVAHPPTSQLADMLERPLFYVDRRLPEPKAVAAQTAAGRRCSCRWLAGCRTQKTIG